MALNPGEELDRSWRTLVSTAFRGGVSDREFGEMARKHYVEFTLAQSKGNQCVAARSIGTHRNTLARIIWKLKIDMNDFKPRRHR